MLKLFIGESVSGEFTPLLDVAEERRDVEIVGVGGTGREIAHAIRSQEVNALVVSQAWAELGRALRISLGSTPGSKPSYILGFGEFSPALVVKIALYGFDAAVPVLKDPNSAIDEIFEVTSNVQKRFNEPFLEQLGLQPGILATPLKLVDASDTDIADLVGAGLPDTDIARVTGKSVQEVRNVIEGLLRVNGLTYRTQLAVLRAASWQVPDFL